MTAIIVVLKLVHAMVGIWLVCGLVGRWASLAQAARAGDIRVVRALLRLSGIFEDRMVIPGSAVVLALGLLTAWLQGQPLLGFLEGARTNWLFVALLLYFSAMALVPLVFLPRGKRFAVALQEAEAREEVTPALTAAFADRVTAAAHAYELIAIVAVLALMIAKPF
jgi:Predicted integral membrane protein (DUF2269)